MKERLVATGWWMIRVAMICAGLGLAFQSYRAAGIVLTLAGVLAFWKKAAPK